jgi:hypothetical protein
MRIRIYLICILQSSVVTKLVSIVYADAVSSHNRYDNQTADPHVCPFNTMYMSDSRSCGDSNRKYRAGSQNTGLFDILSTYTTMPAFEALNTQSHFDTAVSTATNVRTASSLPWQRERYPCNIRRIDLRYYKDAPNGYADDTIYESVIRTLPDVPVVYTGVQDRNKLFAHLSSLQNLTASPSGKNVLHTSCSSHFILHVLRTSSSFVHSLLLIFLAL